MTDINLDPGQDLITNVREKTDAAAGPVLPAEPKYIKKAISDFDCSESGVAEELPPIPSERDLSRTTPSIPLLLERAELLLKHGERGPAAHLIRQALAIHSSHPGAMKLMIHALGDSEFARAEKLIIRRELVRFQPNFENFFEFAKALYANGEVAKAQRAIENAFHFPTEEAKMLFEANKMIGNIHMQAGDLEAAEEYYHKAFAIDAHSASLLVNLGTLAVQRSDWSSARARFSDAAMVASGVDKENHVKALVGLFLASREEQGPGQPAFLEEALKLNPLHRTAVHLFAHWGHQAEEPEAALSALEAYLDGFEFDEEMSLVAIQFYCMLGHFDNALLEAEKTAQWNPGNAEAAGMVDHILELRSGGVA